MNELKRKLWSLNAKEDLLQKEIKLYSTKIRNLYSQLELTKLEQQQVKDTLKEEK